jgi:hypothetical protein
MHRPICASVAYEIGKGIWSLGDGHYGSLIPRTSKKGINAFVRTSEKRVGMERGEMR